MKSEENGEKLTDIFLIKGPQRTDKTLYIMNQMLKKQKQHGALSYLLLGSSGGFLHDFRERYIEKADSIFNSNFKVINQYVVEELKKYHPDKIHVDREMLSALVLDVLADNSELKELLNSGIGIVELFLTYFNIVNEQDQENVFADADGTEDPLINMFAGLYSKFRNLLEANNMFSTYDAYRMIAEIINEGNYYLENNKQFLFIDGFYDFPKPIRTFLTVFIPQFLETYIAVPTTLELQIEEPSLVSFINSLQKGVNRDKCVVRNKVIENLSPSVIDRICDNFYEGNLKKEKESFSGVMTEEFPLVFANAVNSQDQYKLIGSMVKDLVIKKQVSLGEIGIITRNIKRNGLPLSRVFENMGIPYRFEGDVTILESININRLILPFKVFYKGFESEMILNYIESGLAEYHDLSFATLQEVFEKAGLSYGKSFIGDFSSRYSTLKIRKNNWYEKLYRYERFILEKINAYSSSIEDERDLKKQNEESLENIKKVRLVLDDVFDSLGILFSSMKKREFFEYHNYFKYLYEKLDKMGVISNEEFERISVKAFFEDLLPALKHFFIIIKKSKKPAIRPSEFWKYLNIFLENKHFHSSEFIENKCLIMDLESSRYRKTDVRIYADFLDGNYPKIVLNKVYDLLLVNDSPFVDTYIQREERDFVLSLRKTAKKAIFVYPQGDLNGMPYNRSFYIDRFLKIITNKKKELEEDFFLDIEKVNFTNDYAIKDYLISKLDKIHMNDERFIKLCSEFKYDWQEIKRKVELLKFNNNSAFIVENKSTIPKLFGDTLSPSKYGVLKKCYNDFFYQYILKVKTTIEEKEGFDYFVERQILHSILHAVFKNLTDKDCLLENLSAVEFNVFFRNDVQEIIRNEIKAKMFHPEKILYEAEVNFFTKLINDFLKKYRDSKYIFSNPNPEEYGPSVFFPRDFEVEITKDDKVKFIPERDIYFIGKIDRMDFNQNGDFFLYDYKRSESSADKKSSHQLMMYAYATSKLFKMPEGLAFLPIISKKKKITGLCLKYHAEDDLFVIEDARKDRELTFKELLEEIDSKVSHIFQGDFNNIEKVNCYRCPHKDSGLCDIRKKMGDL